MDKRHRDLIMRNLAKILKCVDYERLRPYLLSERIFSESYLARIDEKPNRKLEMLLQVQKRGPTAFKRLLNSLLKAGHNDALDILRPPDGDVSGDDDTPMDVTDAPVLPQDIEVKRAVCLRREDDFTYRMTSHPRGAALIVDNETFESLPPRRGSNVDAGCLARLFSELGYLVVVKKDLRKVSLEYELTTFASDPAHQFLDSTIVAVLSHGENGSVICTNGEKIDVESILQKFNNREAPSLKGKPKIFIFQACRGLKIDHGVEKDGPGRLNSSSSDQDHQVSLRFGGSPPRQQDAYVNLDRNPSFEDMFVMFATIPGYVAYRNNVRGSWFVQCFCKVFAEHSCTEDLSSLMERVCGELKQYCTNRGEKQMCEVLLRGVYKKVYFNPGLMLLSRQEAGDGRVAGLEAAAAAAVGRPEEEHSMERNIDVVWGSVLSEPEQQQQQLCLV